MEKRKHKSLSIVGFLMALVMIGSFFAWSQFNAWAQSEAPTVAPAVDPIADLNAQIEAKRQRIEDLRRQSASYEQAVNQARTEIQDVQSQIAAIDHQIALTNFDIKTKEEEIAKLQLEMTSVQASIDDKNEQLRNRQGQLAETLKQLDRTSRTPLLTVVLTQSNFAGFFDQAQAYASLNQSLQENVGMIRRLKDELQAKFDQLGRTKDDVEQAKLQLEIDHQSTVDQRQLQETLLSSVERTAGQYNELLQQSVREEQQANATIGALERQIQLQLSGDDDPPAFSSRGFLWPVRGTISAYFHDSTYPFRCAIWKSPYCLEHSGLDIAVPQGTPVRATADGVVSVISDRGFYYDNAGRKTRSALNFLGLVHADGISSRYLHLSTIYLKPDQFVKQGEVVGLSGGLPGTAGAGGITTGAHLHFEIRADGIPDDPLRYLP
ncbi:MAG: peptidoglycan DD-metalloendopeptidase family protein [Candidatus Kerfeldbacteria bacterium]|nr:peptidoglycan DD-metalloendopeptidase family protein [Candidatus Kerfeldbacteria bacterium]